MRLSRLALVLTAAALMSGSARADDAAAPQVDEPLPQSVYMCASDGVARFEPGSCVNCGGTLTQGTPVQTAAAPLAGVPTPETPAQPAAHDPVRDQAY
jgi:hypothetical protein